MSATSTPRLMNARRPGRSQRATRQNTGKTFIQEVTSRTCAAQQEENLSVEHEAFTLPRPAKWCLPNARNSIAAGLPKGEMQGGGLFRPSSDRHDLSPSIDDTGPRIPQDQLSTIFELFFTTKP